MAYSLVELNRRLDALIEAIPEDKETRINTVPAFIRNTDRIQTETFDLRDKHKIKALANAVGSVKDICGRMFGPLYVSYNNQGGIGNFKVNMPFFKQTDDIPYIKTWASEDETYRIWKMDQPPPTDWINRLTNIKSYTYESINALLDEAADTITISLRDDDRQFVFTKHNPPHAAGSAKRKRSEDDAPNRDI